jgi:DNA-binding transcriptional LysR family regulator
MDQEDIIPQLNWRQLTTFHVVARMLSFSKAALQLHLSQPAVSAQIRALENQLGVRLFDRLGRRVFLTQAGEVLTEYSQRLINLASEANQALLVLRGLEQGRLAIGASLLVGSYMLPPLLGRFRDHYPKIEIELCICFGPEVADHVAQNRVDFGLVGSPVGHPSLVSEPILADELVVITPGNHAWARRRFVSAEEFCLQPSVFAEEGSSTRRIALQRLAGQGVEPRIVLELGHTEAIKRAVEAGLGISIISAQAVDSEVDSGRLCALRVEGVDLRRNINLLHHRDKSPSDAVRAFLTFLEHAWQCQVDFIQQID